MLTRSIVIVCLIGSLLLPLRVDGQTPDPQLTLKPAIESFRRAKSMTFDVRHETPATPKRKKRIARGHVTLLPSPKGGDADQMKITMKVTIEQGEKREAVHLVWDGRLLRMYRESDKKYFKLRIAKQNLEWPKGSEWINVLVPRLLFRDPDNIVLPEGVEYVSKQTVEGKACHLFVERPTASSKSDGGDARSWKTRWTVDVEDSLLRRLEVHRRLEAEENDPGPAPVMTLSNIILNGTIDAGAFTMKQPKTDATSRPKDSGGSDDEKDKSPGKASEATTPPDKAGSTNPKKE